MGKIFGVLGAGMQGTAAAYDLALWGEGEEVRLADLFLDRARQQADRLNALLGKTIVYPYHLDVSLYESLVRFLSPLDGVLSAIPYFFNMKVTEAAIEAKTHMVDLGGNTDVVFEQHTFSDRARDRGITIIPDCGLAPGLGNIFAVYALETCDSLYEIKIRCGGLPQIPKPPLDYKLVFSIEGLTNEYFGKAYVLCDGKIKEIDTFSDLEEIIFDKPIGKCEAFTTSGGASTCPWSFQGKIQNFDYKTVRYPGHYQKIKSVLDLGLLERRPVKIGESEISPRDLFHAVVSPLITFNDDKDLVVLRATCKGMSFGKEKTIVLETIDFFDDRTGFSAMERTTGFSAALVLEMIVHGAMQRGVRRLEQTIPAKKYISELRKHGIKIKISDL